MFLCTWVTSSTKYFFHYVLLYCQNRTILLTTSILEGKRCNIEETMQPLVFDRKIATRSTFPLYVFVFETRHCPEPSKGGSLDPFKGSSLWTMQWTMSQDIAKGNIHWNPIMDASLGSPCSWVLVSYPSMQSVPFSSGHTTFITHFSVIID